MRSAITDSDTNAVDHRNSKSLVSKTDLSSLEYTSTIASALLIDILVIDLGKKNP